MILIKARNDDSYTPLYTAAYNGHTEIMKILNNHNANINAELTSGEYSGANAIFFAAWNGKLESIKLLIS